MNESGQTAQVFKQKYLTAGASDSQSYGSFRIVAAA